MIFPSRIFERLLYAIENTLRAFSGFRVLKIVNIKVFALMSIVLFLNKKKKNTEFLN